MEAKILSASILIQTLIQLFASIITIYFSINILFRKRIYKQTQATSSTIIIYLYYQLIWGLLTVIIDLYTIFLWRPETYLYFNQKLLYAIGLPSYIVTLLNTVIECFLGLDRCVCIIFPVRYKQKLKPIFAIATLISFILYSAFLIIMNKFLEPFSKDLIIPCRFFGCIILQNSIPYVYYVKLATIIINIIIAIVLFSLLKYYMSNINSKNNKRKIHKTIIYVIVSTTFFELFPNIVGNIYQKVTNNLLAASIGPYSICLVSVNIAVCSWIYYRTLKNGFKKVRYSGIITFVASAKS